MNVWKSLTSTLTRDLGEFASVVQSDTTKLMHPESPQGPESDSDVPQAVAGDENTPEGALFVVQPELLLDFQSEPATYDAIAPDDFTAYSAFTVPVGFLPFDELIAQSSVLKSMHDDLVVKRGKLTAEEFFKRYAFRLLRFRKEESKKALLAKQAQDRDEEPTDLSWDASPEDPRRPADKSDTAQKARIQELELLVSALTSQVDHLKDENAALRATVARLQTGVSVLSPEAKAPSVQKEADDDDDWAQLS